MEADLEGRLRQRLGFALDERLAALDGELGGLLDREARLLMVADQEGLLPTQTMLMQPEAAAITELRGVVERITPTRTFRRADGSVGFVADLDLRDGGTVHRVTLWDEAVRRAQGVSGKAVRLTHLAERTAEGGARAWQSTRGTEVLSA